MDVIKAIHKIYNEEYPGMQGIQYWYTKQDGSPLDNPIDGLVWNNPDHPKPSWEDIEAQMAEVDLDDMKQNLIDQRIKYLSDTDFRVLRFVDEDTPYPGEIKEKRILARSEVNQIESCTTEAELNNFPNPF